MAVIDRPLFTEEFVDANAFAPDNDSIYVFGVSSEQRSEFALRLESKSVGVTFVEIRETDRFSFEAVTPNYIRIATRQRYAIKALFDGLPRVPIYVDITGLGHSVWAPIIRVLLEENMTVRAVYLEPQEYTLSATPRMGEIYDLSERIEGIEPIPLFVSLNEIEDDKVCFVPLLGFEGTRYSHMVEELQPSKSKTFPVVGVPGFRPEYPFATYLGNAGPLDRWAAHRNVRYAKSNCPFGAYYLLQELLADYPDHSIKAGLIGTKPHALGAVLAAISSSRIEIVYDHVKRKKERTTGSAKCLVYYLSEFLTPDRIGDVF